MVPETLQNGKTGVISEKDGKLSFTRVSGFIALISLLGVFILAAHSDEWDTVKSLGADIALLIAGLYGLNKLGTALENRK